MKHKSFLFLFTFYYSIFSQPIPLFAQNFSEFNLHVTNGANAKSTQLEFGETSGYTKGLDIGYDAGLALSTPPEIPGNDVLSSFGIYTVLVEDTLNQGIAFQIQTLPFNNLHNLMIAIGVNSNNDEIVTFSTQDFVNFSSDIKIIMEDRLHNVFTELQNGGSTYETFISNSESEIGRFYLHATSDQILPNGPAFISNLNESINDLDHKITGNCGADIDNGSVKVTTIPTNGFITSYDKRVQLDENGEFEISNPNWSEGKYQIKLSCTDKVGNGPVDFILNEMIFDITPPNKPFINLINEGDQIVTGTGDEGLNISLDLNCTNSPITVNEGIWSCNVEDDELLKKGTVITATIADLAGNINTAVTEVNKRKNSKLSKGNRIITTCKDKNALNYSRFGKHNALKCKYEDENEIVNQKTSSLTATFQVCNHTEFIKNNLRIGDSDSNYSAYNGNIVSDVKLLQKHIQRNLSNANSKKYDISIDGYFGQNTKKAVEELQKFFNSTLKDEQQLIVDGIVGPNTKERINRSCSL